MYDCIVVGAGHAGIEAASALSRNNKSTLLITLNFNSIAKMPCNPSIGGPAKGIVVREIDALGGVMARIADRAAIQVKMLNTTKGPGVWSLRQQSDKYDYGKYMREELENIPHLELLEAMVDEIIVEDNSFKAVKLSDKSIIEGKSCILTTGTYMDASVLVSDEVTSSGPDGEQTSKSISDSLRKLGLNLIRLKTGTPPRVKTSSIDFSKTKYEPGTNEFLTFSEDTTEIIPYDKQIPCYLTYTSPETLKIINENLNKSSMYSGVVKGVGPRYCPSIEDKVVRFSDKERHQLFLEPEDKTFETTYIQGFSSSMPRDIQEKMVHSIIGLENAEIIKYAYAIEYDAIDPLQVKSNLELKDINNLFIAGQILGTSGYEEAAGLGLMAGINCNRKLNNKEPLILKRDEAYIGVMIDDLVTKGTKEPYRLLTSRAEYRLLLRHDNAEDRLIKYGYGNSLINEDRYQRYLNEKKEMNDLIDHIKSLRISHNDDLNNYIKDLGFEEATSYNIYELIKRPGTDLSKILELLNIDYSKKVAKKTDIEIKYEGYILKTRKQAEKMLKIDNIILPENIDYNNISNLALEAREKLLKIKPSTLGQASRISGINPSDIQVLMMYLKSNKLN